MAALKRNAPVNDSILCNVLIAGICVLRMATLGAHMGQHEGPYYLSLADGQQHVKNMRQLIRNMQQLLKTIGAYPHETPRNSGTP